MGKRKVRPGRFAAATIAICLATVAPAAAKIDPSCSSSTATTAIAGVVQDALGKPVPGIHVELYTTNRNVPLPDSGTTGADGAYHICVGQASGGGYDTYDVHAREPGLPARAPVFATASQPYSTVTDLTGDSDFTPASGNPMLYMSSLTITPNAISTVPGVRTSTGDVTVVWTVRSKAPQGTRYELTLGHRNDQVVVMNQDTAENGGPASGGWNRWTYSETIGANSPENLYWSTARGFDPATHTEIAQFDREPYTIDNTPPLIGPSDSGAGNCGPGLSAMQFTPSVTTNPQPIVLHGACDAYENGTRSGLDPFSLRGKMCRDEAMTQSCTDIDPVLNVTTITWFPSAPLALGDYYFAWHIADHAGNSVDSPSGYKMTISDHGGQTPTFGGVAPGNIGSGTTMGVVVGSSLTTPSSNPSIAFRVQDADGQTDIVPGSLHLRVYYVDERSLVYDYDPSKAHNDYDPLTHRGGASFDLSTGIFRADGYPLQGKPPGRYIASASVTDHGGNNATFTWQWVLAAAA